MIIYWAVSRSKVYLLPLTEMSYSYLIFEYVSVNIVNMMCQFGLTETLLVQLTILTSSILAKLRIYKFTMMMVAASEIRSKIWATRKNKMYTECSTPIYHGLRFHLLYNSAYSNSMNHLYISSFIHFRA